MKLLETRNRKTGIWRRYRGTNGERFTTLEIPESILLKVCLKKEIIQSIKEHNISYEIDMWKKNRINEEE